MQAGTYNNRLLLGHELVPQPPESNDTNGEAELGGFRQRQAVVPTGYLVIQLTEV